MGAQECTLISALAAEEQRRIQVAEVHKACQRACGPSPCGRSLGQEKVGRETQGSSWLREEQGMLGALAAWRHTGQTPSQAATLSVMMELRGGDRHLGTSLGHTVGL